MGLRGIFEPASHWLRQPIAIFPLLSVALVALDRSQILLLKQRLTNAVDAAAAIAAVFSGIALGINELRLAR
jgi:Putative Flp pilus-assembly TadE/G-like